MDGRDRDPRVARIREVLGEGLERPGPALREDARYLLARHDALMEALRGMRDVAFHARGCSKGIPLDGDPAVGTRALYAECECGMRQANDAGLRLLMGHDFVEERIPGLPPGVLPNA